MADWYKFKVMFDTPPDPKVLSAVSRKMLGLDSDFPIGALRNCEWVSWRSPTLSEEELTGSLSELGVRGWYWLEMDDGVCRSVCTKPTEFGGCPPADPDDPYSLYGLYGISRAAAVTAARKYVATLQELKLDPLPIRNGLFITLCGQVSNLDHVIREIESIVRAK